MRVGPFVRMARVCAALLLLASACTGGGPDVVPTPSDANDAIPRGGILRLAVPSFDFSALPNSPALDPQKDYSADTWELFRCCLARTLLSYSGRPGTEGAEVRPDLATDLPEVSPDGLTWTFRLKEGIRYAPPLEDTEIVAQDIVRALTREADPEASRGGYSFYYSVIEGFDDVREGGADTISGLETPDGRTLIVRLTRPAGDLANLFAMPATAPVPPHPDDPAAPFGVAAGHDDGFGRFLVATGPYMIEGSGDLDFSAPPARREPASGYAPMESLVLVRNPSWDRSTDELRPAYVDRMEFRLGGDRDRLAPLVDSGELDLLFEQPAVPESQVERYRDNPALESRLFTNSIDAIFYIAMNLAVPPFDDVHVRRAASLAVDKQALLELAGEAADLLGPVVATTATHIAPDSVEGGLLASYTPSWGTTDPAGDLEAARREMAKSRYDLDQDGRCDAPVCRDIFAPSLASVLGARSNALIKRNFGVIGIHVDTRAMSAEEFFSGMLSPPSRVPLVLGSGWSKDYPNAATFFLPLFHSSGIGGDNYALVGARAADLRRWGYDVRHVPSVDAEIEECVALISEAQVRCWAGVDQRLIEEIVPWIPFLAPVTHRVVSERVVNYSFDQAFAMPALDHIAVSDEVP